MSLVALLYNHSILILWFSFIYKGIINSSRLSLYMLLHRSAEGQFVRVILSVTLNQVVSTVTNTQVKSQERKLRCCKKYF